METESSPLRVGVVGLGYAGNVHTRAYKQVPGVEVVALAGLEEDRLQQMGKEYEIPHLYAEWQDLLARDDLDAVSVCVPNFLHAPLTLAALEGGRHVLCEKPLARTTAEAQTMVDAAVKARRVLHTAFNHRRRGDVATLKRFIDEGALGRIYYAKANWMRRNGIPGRGSWFTNKEMSGGGPLIDLGVHALDQALHLMGEPEVITVSASTYAEYGSRGRGMRHGGLPKMHAGSDFEVEDFATAFMRTADGATLLLEASWALQGDYGDDFGVQVFGTEGGGQIDVKNYGWENTLRLFMDQAGGPVTVTPESVRGNAHQGVINDFVAAIRGGDWSAHTGLEGLRRVRIIDACYRSAREGREVFLTEK